LAARSVREVLTDCDPGKGWDRLKSEMDLQQDLLQATYDNGLVLDVGWYEDTRENSTTANPEAGGAFCVACIRHSDWDNPVLSIVARDFDELLTAIQLADSWAASVPP
jgi:hypothetical protein